MHIIALHVFSSQVFCAKVHGVTFSDGFLVTTITLRKRWIPCKCSQAEERLHISETSCTGCQFV